MNNEKETFTKVFEEALNKSIEANKVFLNESSRFFRQLGSKPAANRFALFQGDAMSNAFAEYMKLNLQHFNNLVDLGINFMRKINDTATDAGEQTSQSEPTDAPSFVLEKEAEAGQPVHFQFVLDNVKQQTATCQLVNTGFTGPSPQSVMNNFKTEFNPPVFNLKAGESRSIDIHVHIPADALPGLHTTRVQVKGFEPAYFSILLTVIEPQKQPTPDGGKEK